MNDTLRLGELTLSNVEWFSSECGTEILFHFSGPSGFAEMVSANENFSRYLSEDHMKTRTLTWKELPLELVERLPDVSPRYKPGTDIYWTGSKPKSGTDGATWKDREPFVDHFRIVRAVFYLGGKGYWLYTACGEPDAQEQVRGKYRNFSDYDIDGANHVFDTREEADERIKSMGGMKP